MKKVIEVSLMEGKKKFAQGDLERLFDRLLGLGALFGVIERDALDVDRSVEPGDQLVHGQQRVDLVLVEPDAGQLVARRPRRRDRTLRS